MKRIESTKLVDKLQMVRTRLAAQKREDDLALIDRALAKARGGFGLN